MRNTMPRQGLARPVVGSVTPAPATQLRAANTAPLPVRSPAGMSQERRLTEKRRRDAIQNALGKG